MQEKEVVDMLVAVQIRINIAYFWLLASRLDANNHGRGVFSSDSFLQRFFQ